MLRPNSVVSNAVQTLRENQDLDPEEVLDGRFLSDLATERKQIWDKIFEKV